MSLTNLLKGLLESESSDKGLPPPPGEKTTLGGIAKKALGYGWALTKDVYGPNRGYLSNTMSLVHQNKFDYQQKEELRREEEIMRRYFYQPMQTQQKDLRSGNVVVKNIDSDVKRVIFTNRSETFDKIAIRLERISDNNPVESISRNFNEIANKFNKLTKSLSTFETSYQEKMAQVSSLHQKQIQELASQFDYYLDSTRSQVDKNANTLLLYDRQLEELRKEIGFLKTNRAVPDSNFHDQGLNKAQQPGGRTPIVAGDLAGIMKSSTAAGTNTGIGIGGSIGTIFKAAPWLLSALGLGYGIRKADDFIKNKTGFFSIDALPGKEGLEYNGKWYTFEQFDRLKRGGRDEGIVIPKKEEKTWKEKFSELAPGKKYTDEAYDQIMRFFVSRKEAQEQKEKLGSSTTPGFQNYKGQGQILGSSTGFTAPNQTPGWIKGVSSAIAGSWQGGGRKTFGTDSKVWAERSNLGGPNIGSPGKAESPGSVGSPGKAESPGSVGSLGNFDPNDPIGKLTNQPRREAARTSDLFKVNGKSPFNWSLSEEAQQELGKWGDRSAMTTITTSSGKKVTVSKAVAEDALNFLNELESRGYEIKSLGGFVPRMNVNNPSKPSTHGSGGTIDINPSQNPNKSTLTDMPEGVKHLAAKYGFAQLGDDKMHFERVSPLYRGIYMKRLIEAGIIKKDDPQVNKLIRSGILKEKEVEEIVPKQQLAQQTSEKLTQISKEKHNIVDAADIKRRLIEKISMSKLNGFIPKDAEKYGMKTGSAEEYANLMLAMAAQESPYWISDGKMKLKTDETFTESSGAISEGIWSLSKSDASIMTYRKYLDPNANVGKAFTQAQIEDPNIQADFALGILEHNVLKTGTIEGAGAYWGPIASGKVSASILSGKFKPPPTDLKQPDEQLKETREASDTADKNVRRVTPGSGNDGKVQSRMWKGSPHGLIELEKQREQLYGPSKQPSAPSEPGQVTKADVLPKLSLLMTPQDRPHKFRDNVLNDPLGVTERRVKLARRTFPPVPGSADGYTNWADKEHQRLNEQQVEASAQKRKKEMAQPGELKTGIEVKTPKWAKEASKNFADIANRKAAKEAQQQAIMKAPNKSDVLGQMAIGRPTGGGIKNEKKKGSNEIESQSKKIDAKLSNEASTNRGGAGTGDEGNLSVPRSNNGNSDPPGPGDAGTGPYMECFI